MSSFQMAYLPWSAFLLLTWATGKCMGPLSTCEPGTALQLSATPTHVFHVSRVLADDGATAHGL